MARMPMSDYVGITGSNPALNMKDYLIATNANTNNAFIDYASGQWNVDPTSSRSWIPIPDPIIDYEVQVRTVECTIESDCELIHRIKDLISWELCSRWSINESLAGNDPWIKSYCDGLTEVLSNVFSASVSVTNMLYHPNHFKNNVQLFFSVKIDQTLINEYDSIFVRQLINLMETK